LRWGGGFRRLPKYLFRGKRGLGGTQNLLIRGETDWRRKWGRNPHPTYIEEMCGHSIRECGGEKVVMRRNRFPMGKGQGKRKKRECRGSRRKKKKD